jgi:hypothetical protein
MQTTRLTGQYHLVEGQGTIAELKAEMRQEGVPARRIEVAEVKASLHEKAEGIRPQPVYLISWPTTAGKDGLSGRFIKIPCDGLNFPPEGKKLAETINSIPDVDECAVFLSTRLADLHLGLLLAIRSGETWFEAYRWTDSWNELGLSRLEVCQF